MAERNNRGAALTCLLLLTFLLGEAVGTQGLLPACGPIQNLLTPCYESVTAVRKQPVSQSSECCTNIRRFRFPGCLCIALVGDIGTKIDEKSAVATLSLWETCGRFFPRGFNCTGFAK